MTLKRRFKIHKLIHSLCVCLRHTLQVNCSKITDNTATRVASAIKFGVGDFGLVPCVVITYFSFYLLIIEKTVLSLRSHRQS